MSTKFVHLNLHTEYSIADSIVRIEKLLPQIVAEKMPAVALTDQSNLFAVVKFYQAALLAGVKPIIGVDLWLENEANSNQPFKLELLAQNQVGYRNILQLVSRAYLTGQVLGVPIVKRAWLAELASGLIVLSGGKNGDLGQALLANDTERIGTLVKFWQKVFADRYYLELQRLQLPREEEYLGKAFDLAVKERIAMVATNSVRFLSREDFEAHEARVCIYHGYTLNDENRPRLYSEQQYLRSAAEMVELFQDVPESLVNSVEIAKRCNVELVLDQTFLPVFPVPNDTTFAQYFTAAANVGLQERSEKNLGVGASLQEEYKKRLEYELRVINQMGFAGYFLIVADFISWSKKNGIPVGPGRGSGAGSLVAYVLGITDIDPLKHGLLFERFLNPERVSLPDFDVDFCMDGRDRVIQYVMERYGQEKVAQIITYGTMAARAVVRDVGRVLGYPYGYVDKLAKLIPFALGISLEEALAEEELLRQRYAAEDEVKNLIDLAMKLEGLTRNAGKHAAGVVIAPDALTNFMPLYTEESGGAVLTQLDKDDIEKIGLVKFDFLGLRTLTIIDWTLKSINIRRKNQGEMPIDINLIPLDDLLTYKLLQTGNTAAVFQFESRISRDLMRRFKPDCFSDLVALGAIIRPGVLQSGMLDEIIDRKQGRAKITYLHPQLEPILRPTYGVAIYQEQVMQMAQSLAGYSLGSADLLRRAMGKKKPEEMARQRAVFIEGASKNRIDKHLANTIFDLMEKFAGYGFNKSHSTGYALISYQTAWLKTHYPAAFMAAVLSSDMDNSDKVVLFLHECKKLGLKFIHPDLNQSDYYFVVNENQEIVYGLGAIKGVGRGAVEAILETRRTQGKFVSLFDLCNRVDTRKVNKRVLEALIYAGALDGFGQDRASLIATIELVLRATEQQRRHFTSGQLDLFSQMLSESADDVVTVQPSYVKVVNWSKEERLKHEKEVLGFYLAGHPFEQFTAELSNFVKVNLAELLPELGKNILVAGLVRAVKVVNTKSGKRLAVVTIEDHTASVEVTMFAESFAAARNILIEDQLVIVEGEVVVDSFADSNRIRASKAMSLDEARASYARGLLLDLPADRFTDESLNDLSSILSNYQGGSCPIFVSYSTGTVSARIIFGEEWQVRLEEELLGKLREFLGEGRARIAY